MNQLNSSLIVRQAIINDIPEVMSIVEQNLLSSKEPSENLEQTGFLIHGFSRDDAKNAILNEKDFIYLVASKDDKVIGYTVSCDVKKLNLIYQKQLATISPALEKTIFSQKTLYLRHIARINNKKGVGTALLQALIKQATLMGYNHIICQIAEKPLQNKRSKIFHQKFGFNCVGFNPDSNEGGLFGVYLKKIT